MRLFWRRRVLPTPESGQDLLEFLGATSHQLPPPGFWVYALRRADGTVFRAGQTDHLISRLRDHVYAYPQLCTYSLIKARDVHQADVYEALLIDYYQPSENKAGTAEVEALRRRIANSKGGSGLRQRETG